MPSPATAKRLFEEGKVREAQGELSAYLRERPADTAQRTFLFELLCFAGEYDRGSSSWAAAGATTVSSVAVHTGFMAGALRRAGIPMQR